MTPASSTSWDERHRRLFAMRAALAEVDQTIAIDITDLVIGDQILMAGEPFIVTGCKPDGPILQVEAVSGTRTITNDYLQIERVDVLGPRPPTADPRKALA